MLYVFIYDVLHFSGVSSTIVTGLYFRQDLKDGRFSGSARYRHIHVYTHDKIQHGKSLEIGVVSMATADIIDAGKRKTLSPLVEIQF